MAKNKLTASYQEHLIKKLANPNFSAEYLNSVLEDIKSDSPKNAQTLLLMAIKNIVEAQGGVSKLAESVGLSRQSIYRMLSHEGNPTLSSLISILEASGITLNFQSGKMKAV